MVTKVLLTPDQALAEVLGSMLNRTIIEDENLRNFGFDSNTMIEIIMQVEELCGFQFDGTLCDYEGWKQMATCFVDDQSL